MEKASVTQLKKRISNLKEQLKMINFDIIDFAHEHTLEGQVNYLELLNKRQYIEQRVVEAEGELTKMQSFVNMKGSTNALPGAKVKIKDGSKEIVALLVDSPNNNYVEQVISVNSPLGQALYGKSPGESFGVTTPSGQKSYKLLEVLG